jgi:hypothetical protein
MDFAPIGTTFLFAAVTHSLLFSKQSPGVRLIEKKDEQREQIRLLILFIELFMGRTNESVGSNVSRGGLSVALRSYGSHERHVVHGKI